VGAISRWAFLCEHLLVEFITVQTMHNGLECQHKNKQRRQKQTRCVLPVRQVCWNLQMKSSRDDEEVPSSDVLAYVLQMKENPLAHTKDVNKAAASKDADADCVIFGSISQMFQQRRAQDEDRQSPKKPRFTKEKRAIRNAAPDHVRHHSDDRVAH